MKKLTFVVFAILVAVSCKTGKGDSEKYAHQWAQKHYPDQYKDVECLSSDSDDDGYVSCTVFFTEGPAEASGAPVAPREPMALECAHGHGNSWKCNKQEGCRLATGKAAGKK